MRSLVLFSNDLRLNDNDAINSAIQSNKEISLLFVYDKELYSKTHGSANLWWLEKSLFKLKNNLEKKNLTLNIISGQYTETVVKVASKYNFDSVFLNENKHPDFIKEEENLRIELKKNGIKLHCFNKTNIINPSKILNKTGEPFKVYSPFYKKCKFDYVQQKVLVFPKSNIKHFTIDEKSIDTNEIFSSSNNKWSAKLEKYWEPGEESAIKSMKDFFKTSLFNYKDVRDIPGTLGTSRLSPHLRFGEITTNQIISNFEFHENHSLSKHEEHFIKELYWREFAYYILFHFPYVVDKPFNKKYENFEWENNYETNLSKWKKGLTGIRIVDAAMNELWESGWMHNRTRMITASFLTKNLLIPWQEGEKWFRDTLVDADIANNVMGWQWVSGCGTDAAPYFRIFNPLLQEKKFDPENLYTKKWLKNFDSYSEEGKYDLLENENTMRPIIDLGKSRNIALERFSNIK
jgi:deoxyribodipyrimidine photo-lyase